MNLENVKKIVLFQFRDYHNEHFIREIVNKVYKEVSNMYLTDSNISEDIFCSMLINNIIYYELLKSNKEEDELYIKEIIQKIYTTTYNIKKRNNKEIDKFKTEKEVFEYSKNNYDGKESFIIFIEKYINGYYNGLDNEISQEERKKTIIKEQNEIEVLKRMLEYEKKLKFRF